MAITVITAEPRHAQDICDLVHELAAAEGESTPSTPRSVQDFMAWPGSAILVALEDDAVAGALTFLERPSLFHAGRSGIIGDLVVTASRRGRGIGGALVKAFLAEAEKRGWAEVSVSTGKDNSAALALYREPAPIGAA